MPASVHQLPPPLPEGIDPYFVMARQATWMQVTAGVWAARLSDGSRCLLVHGYLVVKRATDAEAQAMFDKYLRALLKDASPDPLPCWVGTGRKVRGNILDQMHAAAFDYAAKLGAFKW